MVEWGSGVQRLAKMNVAGPTRLACKLYIGIFVFVSKLPLQLTNANGESLLIRNMRYLSIHV